MEKEWIPAWKAWVRTTLFRFDFAQRSVSHLMIVQFPERSRWEISQKMKWCALSGSVMTKRVP